MRISLNWINEFVDIKDLRIEDIVSRFSLVTAEVDGYEQKGKDIAGVVVGEIITCKPHPTSNKPLSVLTVDNGVSIVPVVCGAHNCRVGMKVAFANIGAKLGSFEIGKAKLAGVDSHGMCCSMLELGLGADHDGIIDLDTKLPNGTPIEKAIPEMFDTILEIDNKSLTNRPDLWGHYGVARELSVIFGRKLKPLKIVDLAKYDDLPKLPVKIESKDCLGYGAIRVDNITKRESPLHMQIRLHYCGLSTHGFLVDLTNYVMLETSQPTHAFDASKIDKISVGNVQSGTNFVTLQGHEIQSTEGMLFIKSDGKPVALAGVIGGKGSEICNNTKDCVFEIATFDATSVRKTATQIGTRTDSSNRYEKALDVNLNAVVAGRLLQIIGEQDKTAKVVSAFSHVLNERQRPITITIDKDYLERFCGIVFDYSKVSKNLKALGFNPSMTTKRIKVTVPTWRATKDVTREADVIEEIVRTFGYDNIKPIAPKVDLVPIKAVKTLETVAMIKEALCKKYGIDEVHSYIWNDTKTNRHLNIQTPSYLKVINSFIKENDEIRSELVPSLLGIASKNIKKFDDIRIFEVGRVWTGTEEQKRLAICLVNKKKTAEQLYKELAGIVDCVFCDVDFQIGLAKKSFLHPKNNASITTRSTFGIIGVVHPAVLTNCAIMEINLTNVKYDNNEKAGTISKYPKTTLDFTFVHDGVYGDIKKIFNKFQNPLCLDWMLKDVFEDKYYTLSFTVGSYDKTLESKEIDTVWQAIVEHAKKNGLALKE